MAMLGKANMVHLGSLPCYHRHLSYPYIYSYSYSNSHSSLLPVSRPSFPRCTLRISPLESSFGKNAIKSTLSALRMESTQQNVEEAELLQSLYSIPEVNKAWMHPSRAGVGMEILVSMSQTNLLGNSKRKFFSSVQMSEVEAGYNWSLFPFELSGVSLFVPSPSGKKLLLVKNGESSNKDGSSPVKLELWGPGQLLKEILVPTSVHGHVYADGWFEGITWNEDEVFVAYVAEEPPMTRPAFGCPSSKLSESSKVTESDPNMWKGQGEWQDDWGESYTGKRRPVLFVVNTDTGLVEKVGAIPDDLSVGQVVWAPRGSQALVFTGWKSDSFNFQTPSKLGLKYCHNRPSALYAVMIPPNFRTCSEGNLRGTARQLTSSIKSAFSPRFSPDGKFLVFLSSEAAVESGAHCATNSLYRIEWSESDWQNSALELREVVPIIKKPKDGFPGLYCTKLVVCPWLSDGKTLIASSVWFSTQAILGIDVHSGQVTKITHAEDGSSWTLLDVYKDHVLAVSSSPNTPGRLRAGKCSSSFGMGDAWRWSDIHNPFIQYPEKVMEGVSSLYFEILKIPVCTSATTDLLVEGSTQPFEVVFIGLKSIEDVSKSQQKPPMVVLIHGGPHSAFTTSFSMTSSFLALLGFNLLLVNYRGSVGFGEEALQSLPGHAGSQDVADVLASVDFAIGKGLADPGKIALLGGSHGGFLSTHLIGQAPDRFVTAAVRNPVCNLSTMVGTSDIPDWCFVETFGKGGSNRFSEAPSLDDISSFYAASPIAHVNKVKVPTLFLLGAQDRRVPPSNGIQYIRALRAQGLEVKVIIFPEDAHPIDRPQSDYESFLNIGLWFKRHLMPESNCEN